jgi:hypothetical protein
MSLLSERTLAWLHKMQMNPDKIPMSAAYLRFKAALQAEGERKALLTLPRTRGLSATVKQQTVIEECADPKKLEQWIVRAVSAESVGEVLGTNRKPRTAKPRTRQRAGRYTAPLRGRPARRPRTSSGKFGTCRRSQAAVAASRRLTSHGEHPRQGAQLLGRVTTRCTCLSLST